MLFFYMLYAYVMPNQQFQITEGMCHILLMSLLIMMLFSIILPLFV